MLVQQVWEKMLRGTPVSEKWGTVGHTLGPSGVGNMQPHLDHSYSLSSWRHELPASIFRTDCASFYDSHSVLSNSRHCAFCAFTSLTKM